MLRPTQVLRYHFRIRGCHPLWPNFPDRSANYIPGTGLVRVRSPLLTESRLMSFPPGTEMFQFSGFASPKPILFSLVIPLPFNHQSDRSDRRLNGEGGLSHSEIAGSKPAHGSPTLIAACHVLHRLYMPRHSPDALTSRLRVHTTNNNTGDSAVAACIGVVIKLSQIFKCRQRLSLPVRKPPNRAMSPRHRLKNPFTMSKRLACASHITNLSRQTATLHL